jgi:hypothetical protein
MSATVGVLAQPLERHAGRGRYWRGVIHKANPRSAQYMRDLFAEFAPDGRLVAEGVDLAAGLVGAERVILLYPDAIGLGWGRVEQAVRSAAPAQASTEVLNGRRRHFGLDGRTLVQLRLRRVVERTMLGELIMTPLLLGLAAVLWPLDAVRGRR